MCTLTFFTADVLTYNREGIIIKELLPLTICNLYLMLIMVPIYSVLHTLGVFLAACFVSLSLEILQYKNILMNLINNILPIKM